MPDNSTEMFPGNKLPDRRRDIGDLETEISIGKAQEPTIKELETQLITTIRNTDELSPKKLMEEITSLVAKINIYILDLDTEYKNRKTQLDDTEIRSLTANVISLSRILKILFSKKLNQKAEESLKENLTALYFELSALKPDLIILPIVNEFLEPLCR